MGKGRSAKPRDAPNKIHQANHKKQWILPEVLYKLVLEQSSLTFINSVVPTITPTCATNVGKLSFQKCFTSLFWSNAPSFLSNVLLWSYVLNLFITLPARTPTFATILCKLSFQKCFTSLFGSFLEQQHPLLQLGIAGSLQRSCGKPHPMRAPFYDWHRDAEHTNQRGARWGPTP